MAAFAARNGVTLIEDPHNAAEELRASAKDLRVLRISVLYKPNNFGTHDVTGRGVAMAEKS